MISEGEASKYVLKNFYNGRNYGIKEYGNYDDDRLRSTLYILNDTKYCWEIA